MALKAYLSEVEHTALPESQQSLYKKSEGDDASKAFLLDAEGVEDVGGLKSALAAERTGRTKDRNEYTATVSKYKEISDPAEALAAMQKVKEIEEQRLKDAGEFETLKGQIVKEKEDGITAVKQELGGKLSKTESKLRQIMIENAIMAEANTQGVFPKAAGTFVKLASEFVELEATDDDFVPKVKDGKGSSITELVTNLKGTDEYGIFFQADVAAGSGATPSNADAGSADLANLKRSEMSDLEKAKYIRENGRTAETRKGSNPAFEELPWK